MNIKKIKWKHYINYIVIGIFTAVLGSMSVFGSLNASLLYLLEKTAISIILAVSLSLVVGFLGELSLGHAGFMCVGAYIGGKVSALLAPSLGNGIPTFLISLLVGAAVAALCGIIIGIPALRLRGDYLAIVTLAFGEIVRSIFQNTSRESFGGAIGLSTPRFDKKYLFIIAFVLVLFTLAIIQNLIRSKHGRAVTAIRDNEIAARATGINVTKYKLITFTLSAAFAGIAGVLYSYSNYTVQSAKFGYNYSIEILVMVVLGGIGSINGSIISAALITFLNIKLQTLLPGDYYASADPARMKSYLDMLRKFANDFTADTYCNFLMIGATGLGKTHLSSAVAKAIIDKGFDVLYVTSVGMTGDFEAERFGNSVGTRQRNKTSRYYEAELLIIDDLGTEVSNQFTLSCLYDVINTRINKHLCTFVNTNLTPKEIDARYSERITSRLFGEYIPVVFSGKDIRRQKISKMK